jgi:hypothetical protein
VSISHWVGGSVGRWEFGVGPEQDILAAAFKVVEPPRFGSKRRFSGLFIACNAEPAVAGCWFSPSGKTG